MSWVRALGHRGVRAALASAALFGAGTPLAKLLLGDIGPWMLAALLYLGSGIGLTVLRWLTGAPRVRIPASDVPWLVGAITAGGVLGPVLLMVGLSGMPASGASLLLNAEGVLTAGIAWLVFRENVDRRVGLGMAAIVMGAIILSWSGSVAFAGFWPAAAILGACLAWAVDNNLTRKVSLSDATWLARTKGLAAGSVNLLLALAVGAGLPGSWLAVVGAGAVGLLSYGVSLALFVVSLRELGTARAGAYFSSAPFLGAGLAVVMLGEPLTGQLAAAGALMALGVWLHLTERHEHEHTHEAIEHAHAHTHDEHHGHGPGQPPDSHAHRHETITHTHAHYPDAHHRHPH